ncbi:Hypothetical protein A7982_06707 [Minicystis rosea]|nr:Hypothetical protein A7982_06707 [Minicystis rosea]
MLIRRRVLFASTILIGACSPPPSVPSAASTASALPAATSAPAAPPARTAETAAPSGATPARSTRPTTVWEVEPARGTTHEVRSLARVGDSIWAAGWYGDPDRPGQTTALPVRKGDYDPFVSRIDEHGTIAWQGPLEGASGAGVARSTDGEVLVAGEFVGEVKGALVPKSPVLHAFVAKLDASGKARWTSGPNTMDIEHAWAIAAAPEGGAYLASELHAVVRKAGEPSSKGAEDILVSRYDAQGKRLWRTPLGSARSDWPFSLASLPDGDVLVAGATDAPTTYSDNAAVTSQGIVARLGADGSTRWEKRFGGPGVSFAGAVAASASGRIVMVGVVTGEVRLGAQTYRAAGHHDMVLVEMDGNGEVSWVRRLATTRSPRTDSRYYGRRFVLLWGGGEPQYLSRFGNGFVPASIAVAPDGSMAVGGWFVDEITIGETSYGASMKESGFIASLGADGQVRWVTTPDEHVNAVLAENDGVVAATGGKVVRIEAR